MQAVEYEIREDDLVQFGVLALRISPVMKAAIRKSVIAGVVVIVLFWLLQILSDASLAWILPVVGVPGMVLAVPRLMWWLAPRRLRAQFRTGTNRGVLGKHKLELLEDGVRRTHSQGETKSAWSAVERLVCGKSHLAMFISANQAFVVPRRAFGPALSEAEFRATAEKLAGRKFEEVPY